MRSRNKILSRPIWQDDWSTYPDTTLISPSVMVMRSPYMQHEGVPPRVVAGGELWGRSIRHGPLLRGERPPMRHAHRSTLYAPSTRKDRRRGRREQLISIPNSDGDRLRIQIHLMSFEMMRATGPTWQVGDSRRRRSIPIEFGKFMQGGSLIDLGIMVDGVQSYHPLTHCNYDMDQRTGKNLESQLGMLQL